MTIGERLDEVRKQGSFNGREFAETLEITPQAYVNYSKDKRDLPMPIALKINQMFNISIDWLLTGKGEMLFNDVTIHNTLLSKDLVSINYYEDIYASAGLGSYAEDCIPVKMEFDRNFLENILNIRRFDNLDIIRVTGDSMLPYIKDGEFIIVERCSDAKSGDTVIANIEGELYVKRLKKVPFEKWLILESENHDYSPIELNTMAKLQAFTIIGIMRSKIKLY